MHKLLSGCVVAIAILGACKKSGGNGDQTKAKRDSCMDTAKLLAEANIFMMPAGKPKPTETEEKVLIGGITAECVGSWTEDAASCYLATKGPEDLPECDKKLTAAQKASYDKAVADAFSTMHGAAAGSGSAAGSGATGSGSGS